MHYYSFNIADYKKDTEHLMPIEHYIYRALIDRYYLDEKPIPLKTQSVMRRLSLVVGEHETMLENVLSDFFHKCDDGYRHKRIDAELAKYQSNAEKNRLNGAKGGRPRKNKPRLTQSVIDGNPVATQINPNQEPLTKNQEPLTSLPFDDFWNAYDYKKGGLAKPKAKWLSLSIETQKLIMAHVPRYVKSTPNKSYRKHPMTYLNNEGWLDEITELDNTDAEQSSSARPHSNRSDSFDSQPQAKALSREEQLAFNKINMELAFNKINMEKAGFEV